MNEKKYAIFTNKSIWLLEKKINILLMSNYDQLGHK